MKTRASVSPRALLQRLNRVLLKDGEQIKRTRGVRAQLDLGDYFVLDINGNYIAEKDVDLEEFGRKYKVLAAWEKLSEEKKSEGEK
jgi:hypothetical protein